MDGKEGGAGLMEHPSEEQFREKVAGGFAETKDKLEQIATEKQLEELTEYAEKVDNEITELEGVQESICTEEHGADWKSNPEIAPLLGGAGAE